ncbi:hypothetical protein [Azospirillum picis]|uniref:SWIM-type domain-containing protein n=1 Tax=Azospirillum picis TaxID=488438 RepID=A0ABU0MS19_9PROT|nr:hypothetical protein [Azospirillum picis]MBP2302501.1 hypothetical protein [Azospirillum picis]MDQ0536257.1 hypothetical protein [Azospirillum picis]
MGRGLDPRHDDARGRDALAFEPLPTATYPWCFDGGRRIVIVVQPPNAAVDRLLAPLDGATPYKLPYDPRRCIWSHTATHWHIPCRHLDAVRALLPPISRLMERR